MNDLLRRLSAHRWFGATDEQRDEVLGAVAAQLGEDFESAGVERFGENAIGRVRHLGSGIVFSVIPGGVFVMGLSDDELARFEQQADEADDGDEARHWVGDGGRMRPAHDVDVAPFLLAASLPTPEQFEALTSDKWVFSLESCVPPAEMPGRVEALAKIGLKLPSEAEWEFAVRAGTRRLFPHQDEVPEHPGVPANGFGIEWASEWAETCADGWHADYEGAPATALPWAGEDHVFRGGSAAMYPWQGCGEWTMMMCAGRNPPQRHEFFWAIRPALSLFDPDVAYSEDAIADRAAAGHVVRPACRQAETEVGA